MNDNIVGIKKVDVFNDIVSRLEDSKKARVSDDVVTGMRNYYSTKSRKKALLYTFISGMAEFFGALLTMVILKNYLNNNILCIILYFIGCLMLLISLTEIRPEILKYKEKRYILYGLIVSLFILLV